MRVLIVSASYNPVLGGLQTVTHNLAKGLLQEGLDTLVITTRYPRLLLENEVIDGVPVRRLMFLFPSFQYIRNFRLDLFGASLYFHPLVLRQLTKLMESFQPDVVNFHYPLHQIPYILWLRKYFSFRMVVSLHGDEILPWVEAKRGNVGTRKILESADAVTACSQWLLNKTIQFEPSIVRKSVVIHNGVDAKRFADKTAYLHSKPYLFAYGRLSYQKGFDLLIDAFAKFSGNYPDMDLILVGGGEERERLNLQIQHLDLEERVHLRERATPERIVQFLNGCRFVVIPSRWEPFGIVTLEALAAGKPILATCVGGTAEILADYPSYSRLIFPDVASLVDGLDEMMKMLPLFDNLPPASLDQFAWKNVIGQYEKVLSG